VHDTSGSMQATDVAPDRLSAARDAARTLANSLPEEFRLGVVQFNTRVEQLSEPTTDRSQVLRALDGLDVEGGTAMGDGLQLGIDAIAPTGARGGCRARSCCCRTARAPAAPTRAASRRPRSA
jgi:Mg-chelatase subunit ChlD